MRAIDAFPLVGGMTIEISFTSTKEDISGPITERVDVDVSRAILLTRRPVSSMPSQIAVACAGDISDLEPNEFLMLSQCGRRPCQCQVYFLLESIENAEALGVSNGSETFTYTDDEDPERNHTDTNPDPIYVEFSLGDIVVCDGQNPVHSQEFGLPLGCFDQDSAEPITPTVEVVQAGSASPGVERYADQIIRLTPSGTHFYYAGSFKMRVPSFTVTGPPSVVIPESFFFFSLDGPLNPRLSSGLLIVSSPDYAVQVLIDGQDGIRIQWMGFPPQPIPPMEFVPDEFVGPLSYNLTAITPKNRVSGTAAVQGLIYGGVPGLDMLAELTDPCAGDLSFSFNFSFDNQDEPDPDPDHKFKYEWNVSAHP